MHGSDWRKFVKDYGGLVVTSVIAALFAIVIVIPAMLDHGEVSREASHRAANYAEYAQNNIPIKCAGLTGQPATDCADEINEAAREGQRAEYDVAAQEIMSIWTAVMGGVAVLGVALSAVGVYLIWQTWRQTQEAANSSAKNLAAFKVAERAQIVVDIVGGSRSDTSNVIRFQLKLFNIGRTPAKVLAVYGQSLTNNVPPSEFKPNCFEEFIIEAGQKSEKTCMTGINNVKRYQFIGGYIDYRCKFGDSHRSYFCFEVSEAPEHSYASIYSHYTRDCKRDRDWPEDT